jgi:hypothetical protein
MIGFELCFNFLMRCGLKGIGIDCCILSISEGIVVKRSIVSIGLSLDDFSPDLLHLFFESYLMFGLFLQSSHHLIYGFVSLLLQTFILLLMSREFIILFL